VRAVLVLPTYNERENIEPFLRSVRAQVPELDIIVVDDNSPDGTGKLAYEIAVQDRSGPGRTMVEHRYGKEGLGSAYRHGFAAALAGGYEAIVSMDADFSHDPAVLPAMLSLLAGNVDLVIGSRYVPGGATANWPARRRLLSRWGNRYTGLMLGLPVRDCTAGYRAYRASKLAEIDPGATRAEGYAFLTELLARLVRAGATVVETPIVFRDRAAGTSKMSGRIIAESMLLVTRWGLQLRWERLMTRLGRR
jgi:dolichol-phosphate mannosyltransferase